MKKLVVLLSCIFLLSLFLSVAQEENPYKDADFSQLTPDQINKDLNKIKEAGRLHEINIDIISTENLRNFANFFSPTQIQSVTDPQRLRELANGLSGARVKDLDGKTQLSQLLPDLTAAQKKQLTFEQIAGAMNTWQGQMSDVKILTKLGSLKEYDQEQLRKALNGAFVRECDETEPDNECLRGLTFLEGTDFRTCSFSESGILKCGTNTIDLKGLKAKIKFSNGRFSLILSDESVITFVDNNANIMWRDGTFYINNKKFTFKGKLLINVASDGGVYALGDGTVNGVKITSKVKPVKAEPKIISQPDAFGNTEWRVAHDIDGDGYYDKITISNFDCRNPLTSSCAGDRDETCAEKGCGYSQAPQPKPQPVKVKPKGEYQEPTPQPQPQEPPEIEMPPDEIPDQTPLQPEEEPEEPVTDDEVEVPPGSDVTMGDEDSQLNNGGVAGTGSVTTYPSGQTDISYVPDTSGKMTYTGEGPVKLEFNGKNLDANPLYLTVDAPGPFVFSPHENNENAILESTGDGTWLVQGGEVVFPKLQSTLDSEGPSKFRFIGNDLAEVELAPGASFGNALAVINPTQDSYFVHPVIDAADYSQLAAELGDANQWTAMDEQLLVSGKGKIWAHGEVELYENNPMDQTTVFPLTAAVIYQPYVNGEEGYRLLYDSHLESNDAELDFTDTKTLSTFYASGEHVSGSLFTLYLGYHIYEETTDARFMKVSPRKMSMVNIGEYSSSFRPEILKGQPEVHGQQISSVMISPDPSSEAHYDKATELFFEGSLHGYR